MLTPAPAEVTVKVPAFSTVTVPPPVWVISVTFSEPLLFSAIFPLAEFVAWKLLTRFVAPSSVVPVAEVVVSSPPVITAKLLCVMSVDAVRFTPLDPAETAPVRLISPPALLTVTSPVPVWLMPVTDSVAVLSCRMTTPAPLLLALKLSTVFAPVRVVPVTETVLSRPVVLNDPD